MSRNYSEPISGVQQAALIGLLRIKGYNYEELVREAFNKNGIYCNKIPSIEALTYFQALTIIKFGNKKIASDNYPKVKKEVLPVKIEEEFRY